MRTIARIAFAALLAATIAAPAAAAPITLVPNTLNFFRDTRGDNDVGIGGGDRFQFGADIQGGSAGSSVGATYQSGFNVGPFGCAPLAVNANFCATSTAFNANRLGQWQVNFVNGPDQLVVAAPSLAGTETAAPKPQNVTISSSGVATQPIISWTLPPGYAPDGLRVNVYDKSKILANGQADVIHVVAVAPGATSYQLPGTLSSGLSLVEGGNYTIGFQVIETRGDVSFTNNNAQILKRSSSFFAFTPLNNGAPPNVALPTVVNGVFHFDITTVGPNSVTFIDPFVAVGYAFAIGAGDPNFASVILPDIGDGLYTVEFDDGGSTVQASVLAGDQFFFGGDGVDAFKVLGIETSAGLDPNDATAFITGLTFVSEGSFTGTMTPITQFVPDVVATVPEPASLIIFGSLVASLGAVARGRRRERHEA